MGEGLNRAWVLVNTMMGKEREALQDLRRIPGVKEAHLVTGEFDIMVLIEASTMKQLEDMLTWNIRRQRNICATVTMIVV